MKAAKISFLIYAATSLQTVAYAQPPEPEILNSSQTSILDQRAGQIDPTEPSDLPSSCVSPGSSKGECLRSPRIFLDSLSQVFSGEIELPLPGGLPTYDPNYYGDGPCAPLAIDFCKRLESMPLDNVECKAIRLPGHVIPMFCYGDPRERICCLVEPQLNSGFCMPFEYWFDTNGNLTKEIKRIYEKICTETYENCERDCRYLSGKNFILPFCSEQKGKTCSGHEEPRRCLDLNPPPRISGRVARLSCVCAFGGCYWE